MGKGWVGLLHAKCKRVHKRTSSDVIPAVDCPTAGVIVYYDLLDPVLH